MLTMLACIGLIRYAYSPLVPVMIKDKWLTDAQVGYIGMIGFVGSLLGAVLTLWLSSRISRGWLCRVMLILGFLSVAFNAVDLGIWWIAGCRLVAGIAAVSGMILAPNLCTDGIKESLQGRVLGFTFAGAGIGIVLLSLTLPSVMGSSAMAGWLYTAGLVLICLLIAWPGLRSGSSIVSGKSAASVSRIYRGRLILQAIGYFIASAAIIPHSIYLAAYIHIELHQPIGLSVMIYAIFGTGIMLGAITIDGFVTPLLGQYLSMLLALVVGLVAILMVVLSTSVWLAAASGFVLGLSQMGFASVAAHRVLTLAGKEGHVRWWGIHAILFNSGMAVASFAMGYMIQIGWGFKAGFWMAGGCFLLAIVINAFIFTPRNLPETAS